MNSNLVLKTQMSEFNENLVDHLKSEKTSFVSTLDYAPGYISFDYCYLVEINQYVSYWSLMKNFVHFIIMIGNEDIILWHWVDLFININIFFDPGMLYAATMEKVLKFWVAMETWL